MALTLVAQPWGRPSDPAAESARRDLEFVAAVEDSIGPVRAPAPYGPLIAGLGASDWRGREAASAALVARLKADPGGVRWALRARRHRDPEIRVRAVAAIRRAFPCPACGGRGWMVDTEVAPWEPAGYACGSCRGRGGAWVRGPFDDPPIRAGR